MTYIVVAKAYKEVDGRLELLAIAEKPTKAKTKSGIRKALKNWGELWALHFVGCTYVETSVKTAIV